MARKKNMPNNAMLTTSLTEERGEVEKQIFSNVSHDIKTPLACIIGALEIYERMDDKLTCEKKQILVHTALLEARKLNIALTKMINNAVD